MNPEFSSRLPSSLFCAAQVRAMDRYAIDRLAIPGIELMRRAGLIAFKALRHHWPNAKTVSVLCGSGNNAGDGYVVARLAFEAGMDVRAFPIFSPDQLTGDALLAYRAYRDCGGAILDFIPSGFEGAEVLVDALLGTGLDRDVTGHVAAVINAMNRHWGDILALDIPSGLNADTGAAMGVAIRAAVTVSFIGLKRGLFTGDGPEHSGIVHFDGLETPPEVRQSQNPTAELLDSSAPSLARRNQNCHKGHFGHVLVLGGEPGYSGAVRLAAEAALRVGAGLVSVGTHPEHARYINISRPELMSHAVRTSADLDPLLSKASVIAVGPGLGQTDWGHMIWSEVLKVDLPMVVDADALNLLADQPVKRSDWVLTPHPGEAARLLKTTSRMIQSDRFAAIEELQDQYGGTVVLKGSGSLVLGNDGLPAVCRQGNGGMSSGGMGDVLTGVIAGLMAQGLEPLDATCLGVRLHAMAGDIAASQGGERGLLASDLFPFLRSGLNS